MKYTIELTSKQKDTLECVLAIVHRYIGFNAKLEMDIPIPMKESPAYKKGFEDGKKQAIEEIPELANKENEIYNDGYNKGLEDARQILLNLLKIPSGEWGNMFDRDSYYVEAIFKHYSINEIAERIKAYEEKKKAEEESIKVGDEVITSNGYIAIITFICDEYMTAIFDDGSSGEFINETLKKTGRHFGEVEQLLDKLRGVKSEE